MKLTSRITEQDDASERLREIIEICMDGEMQPEEMGDDLHEVVTTMEHVSFSMLEALGNLEFANQILTQDLDLVLDANDKLGRKAENLLGIFQECVPNDDDLDDATGEVMQDLMASGAAEATFNGEISFDERVVFSKADLKPILQAAIATWLSAKLEKLP